ncbi:hypothetical protein N7501_004461 [Penicillium viridicatum]|nr:hypothetical protein N7501_004461 [Penicillium viridicatum]
MVRNLSDVATLPGYIEPPSKFPRETEDEDLGDDDEEPIVNDLDTGALVNELMRRDLMPKKVDLNPHEKKCATNNPESLIWKFSALEEPASEQEVSYRGTQLALTKVYDLIEQRYMAFTDVTGIEPLLPFAADRVERKDYFAFTKTKDDGYPPHLDLGLNKKWPDIGNEDPNWRSTLGQRQIFNPTYLYQLAAIMSKLVLVPSLIPGVGTPASGKTIAEVEKYNRDRIAINRNRETRQRLYDIFDRPNVGELEDWYSDARFAQQQFTGTNPTTIQLANEDWLTRFSQAAEKEPEDAVAKDTIDKLIEKHPESFYVQDYSYFRDAAGIKTKKAEIKCHKWFQSPRWGCAAVCLFFLDSEGLLHPLAIVTDWRDSMETSVTIFNRELFKRMNLVTGKPKDPISTEKRIDEAADWPWRYAKTCVQVSDWFRHEVTAHLTRTHLVEEAIIVSANRQFDPTHPVFMILRPHWQKTLALNASARGILVPSVILRIVGFEDKQALNFIQSEYKTYEFKESYVPTDLRNRGFPPEQLDSKKFRNYTYARCVNSMWKKIRTYVNERLLLDYGRGLTETELDKKVEADISIRKWWQEMQAPSGADLRSFPEIKTFEQLVDCVTMCIHIASPQHTAVNYLQDYYQGFVINKPSCLFAPPPTSLKDLLAYTETDLIKALPIGYTREWLLSSHVPYLLSFKPDEKKETLIGCIESARALVHDKESPEYKVLDNFWNELGKSAKEFQQYADEKWDAKDIPYTVLKPKFNAVSILI